jgi:hypothetical protein
VLHFVACGIARHDLYSWGQINPQKTTHQIDRICGAREYYAVVSALSICVCEEHTYLSTMLKKGFGRASLKTSAIASNVVIVGVREAPYTTGRSSKGQLQQERVM